MKQENKIFRTNSTENARKLKYIHETVRKKKTIHKTSHFFKLKKIIKKISQTIYRSNICLK